MTIMSPSTKKKITNLWSFCKANNITSSQLRDTFPSHIQSLAYNVSMARPTDDDIRFISCEMSKGNGLNRDGRSNLDFGLELVISWLWEQSVALKLGLLLNPDSCDNERSLYIDIITNTADLVDHSGATYEVMVDHTGFSNKTGCLDLRCNKFDHMVSTKTHLVVAYPDGSTRIIDPSACNHTRIQHPVWNKPAVRININ